MLEVESFLKQGDNFISIINFYNLLSDINYIEGAIKISYQQKEILTLDNWDLIDQLWGYFVTGLEQVSKGEKFETYFPDQPLKIAFEPNHDRKRVQIKVGEDENLKSFVNYDEFVAVMAKEGKFFFRRMIELSLSPKSYYEACIKDLDAIEKTIYQ